MARKAGAILDAASLVFSRRGFDGVGLREIAAKAGVAQPTINYHFSSKENLLEAVVARGAENTVGVRVAELQTLLEATPNVTLEDIVQVLFRTYNQPELTSEEERVFNRFIAKLSAGESVDAKRTIMEAYDEMATHFVAAMQRTPDGFDAVQAAKAYLYALPTGMFGITHAYRIPRLSGRESDAPEVQFAYEDLVAFLCAGMRQMLR